MNTDSMLIQSIKSIIIKITTFLKKQKALKVIAISFTLIIAYIITSKLGYIHEVSAFFERHFTYETGETLHFVLFCIFLGLISYVIWLKKNSRKIREKNIELTVIREHLEKEISEYRKTERGVKENNGRFRMLLETISDAVIVIDHDWRYVFANETALNNILKLPREKVIGNKVLELFPGLRDKEFFNAYKKVMKNRCTEVLKARYSLAEASPGWCEIRIYPVSEGIMLIIIDITEKVLLEQTIMASEEKYRALFNNVNDSVFVLSMNDNGTPGSFIEVNDIACKTLKYSRNELLSMTPEHIDNIVNMPNLSDMVYNLMTDGHTTLETVYVAKDGERIPVEIIVHVFEWKGKEAILSIAKDISKQKNAELKLRESEERYKLLVNILPDAIFVLNKGKIAYANDMTSKVLGAKSSGQIVGRDIKDFIHPDYRDLGFSKMKRIMDNNEIIPFYEQKCLTVDGKPIEVELTGRPFPYNGGDAILGVGRDITEKKRNDELKNKMEEHERLLNETLELDRLRTEFFANLSHELRTPLNIIFNSLQLVELYQKQDAGLSGNIKLKKQVVIMRQNCFRLIRLINNLIDITRIDAGFYEITKHNCNISRFVEGIASSVADYIENMGIKLTFKTNCGNLIIACDLDKIERVILNILSNAVKFTRRDGEIDIHLYEDGSGVYISVKDTGIGIPEDKLAQVFERFRQVDKSLIRETEGSGIGLSLVKAIIEMHNGKINVKSKQGKGSEFTFLLPKVVLADCTKESEEKDVGPNKVIDRIQLEFSDIYNKMLIS